MPYSLVKFNEKQDGDFEELVRLTVLSMVELKWKENRGLILKLRAKPPIFAPKYFLYIHFSKLFFIFPSNFSNFSSIFFRFQFKLLFNLSVFSQFSLFIFL